VPEECEHTVFLMEPLWFSVPVSFRCGLGLVQAVDEGVQGLQERLDERGLVAVAIVLEGLGRRLRSGINDMQFEIAGHFLDDFNGNWIPLVDEGADQGMFAQ
jgi:hypothetical protein